MRNLDHLILNYFVIYNRYISQLISNTLTRNQMNKKAKTE